jgi:peptide/nickel transport system substrate-binding protein
MRAFFLIMLAASLVACASPTSTSSPRQGDAPAAQTSQSPARTEPQQSRTLAGVIRVEPASIAGKGLQPSSLTLGATVRTFNAGLTIIDDHDQARPYLAESLPQLNTDTWKVNTDGTMETIYKLKPNLTWHDGAPLTADDFVFAFKVYTTPDFGIAGNAPQGLMSDVVATDPQTVTILWKRPYPFANVLEASGNRSLPPLPRHLLESQIQQTSAEAVLALPFWTTGYVGAGPFKVTRWDPGSAIEATAFDGHALGRPKIDRLQLRFISDANTALSNILAGNAQLLADDAIYFQQATVLQREWAGNQAGSIVIAAGLWRYMQIQLSPAYNGTPPLTDLRVRQALAYGLDKEAINDGIYEGQGIRSESVIPPTADYYPIIDRAVVKHPFDARRSEQLMADAGFTKGGDGFFTHPSTGRFSPELKVIQSPQNEAEQSIMADGWRRIGFDIRQSVLPAAQAQDAQLRAQFPDMFTTGGPTGESVLPVLGTAGIPRAETRWNGTNRSGWTNTEYDRLVDAYNTTLDRDQRIQHIARMVAIFSEELPAIAVNFNPGITAFTSALKGPAQVGADGVTTWNIHEWELK